VFDEADFMHQDPELSAAISEIQQTLPKTPPCVLQFSATLEDTETVGERAELEETYLLTPAQFKDSYCLQLLTHFKGKSFILFVPTCLEAEVMHRLIAEFGFDNLPLHSKMTQRHRLFNLQAFKSSKV
jgi:superfamily II DNA/RNA helicase